MQIFKTINTKKTNYVKLTYIICCLILITLIRITFTFIYFWFYTFYNLLAFLGINLIFLKGASKLYNQWYLKEPACDTNFIVSISYECEWRPAIAYVFWENMLYYIMMGWIIQLTNIRSSFYYYCKLQFQERSLDWSGNILITEVTENVSYLESSSDIAHNERGNCGVILITITI